MTEFEKLQQYWNTMGNRNTGSPNIAGIGGQHLLYNKYQNYSNTPRQYIDKDGNLKFVSDDNFTGSSPTYMPVTGSSPTYMPEEPASYEYDMNPAAPPYEYDMNPATTGSIGNIGGYDFRGSVVDEPLKSEPPKYETPNWDITGILSAAKNLFGKKDITYDDSNYQPRDKTYGIEDPKDYQHQTIIDKIRNYMFNKNNLSPNLDSNLPSPNRGPQFTEDTDPYSKAKKNFITNKFLMRDTNARTDQGDYTQGGQKVSETGGAESTGFKWPSIFGGIMEKFQRSPEKQKEIDAFNKTGMFGNLEGRMRDAPSGLSQVSLRDPKTGAVVLRDKNVDSWRGSDTIQEQVDRKNKWIRDRLIAGKGLSTNLRDYASQTLGLDQRGNFINQPNTGSQFTGTIPTGPIDTGQGQAYTGPPTQDFNRAQAAKAGSYNRRAGPMSGSYGPWGGKKGGRAGYAFAGPVGVEQQTDFIEGPQGTNEFQETVVEGQEQPSREQLEALAMKIFQLPLEELDEQQLVVVYQTAMQGQPMQESVQEEDVQFAANGGLAGLL